MLAVSNPLIADRLCLPSLIQSALLLRLILMGCSMLAGSLLASSLVSTSGVKQSHLSTLQPTHCHLSPHFSHSQILPNQIELLSKSRGELRSLQRVQEVHSHLISYISLQPLLAGIYSCFHSDAYNVGMILASIIVMCSCGLA